jgi:sugar phosphate permease
MPTTLDEAPAESLGLRRLRRRQALTLGLLIAGYSGYYLCRSNLSVAMPLIAKELVAGGMTLDDARGRLGWIASLGTLAYALGKFLSGGLGDYLGGRRNFLGGMLGAILATLVFAAGGGMPIFTIAWIANRLTQSLGWVGMVKIAGRWFDYRASGTVMGLISLSFLFGDAAARQFYAVVLGLGFGWRGMFVLCAGVLAGLMLACTWLLRESPSELGLREGEVNPSNVYGAEGDRVSGAGPWSILGPLLRRRTFWYVCILSMALTLLREIFGVWSPTYFHEVARLSPARSSSVSALFPFWGGISVLLAGFLGDRMGRLGRSTIILAGMLLTGLALWQLGRLPAGVAPIWPVVGVTLVGFLLIGPYSYLAGAVALDFGGKRGGGTASGIIDGVGYLAGSLAGRGVAELLKARGWSFTFMAMAGLAWASALVALLYLREQSREPAGAS